jgi:chemotaxis methyl-accepting protein methylase/signal transduction histidine kinase
MGVRRVKKLAKTAQPPPRTARGARAKKADSSLCVVAIGASAGGFDALVQLLRRLPANCGLALIILQHLSPSPKSLSAELFSRHTSMKVCTAADGMHLEANCVYTTPADQDIRVKAGHIRLSKPIEAHGHRLPVDHLFRSLGQDQRERAIGIILSGTGSDGTLGLKDIIANGGIVLVQAPETAQFDGMPRSAIATGLVGYVLAVTKMPRVLVGYARHSYVRAPIRVAPRPRRGDPVAMILGQLQTGHRQSFAGYKQAMVVRRIERRMGLLNIPTLDEYARRVKRDAAEATALRKDLLIGVTEFFRDRPAWDAFDAKVLRRLIAAKKAGEPIRAWVAGAATGEEAYTLAILILARLKASRKRCGVQIFGTDANLDSLHYARAGRYPLGIRAQVGEELLKRYFEPVKDDHHYQVNAEVRESVIFGEHDLLADPPFSRLDIVTCRNVLIYIEPVMQARILMLCHFALRANGHLILGSAETLGVHEKLFKTIDRKWHIYRRIGSTPRDKIEWPAGAPRLPASPALSEPLSEAARLALHGDLARSAVLEPFAQPPRHRPSGSANGRLRQKLRVTQEDLRSAVSQLKSSNEDLRASHEETISSNEELQSMNEELESSKEELQSVNEELNTVNTQLQTKVTELEVANTDLRNLLASNEVATLCIDRSFRIKWFTPAAHQLFNLLPADIGRPITDLSLATLDSTLMENARAVLQGQTPRSQELKHKGYLLRRIVPYRTDNRQIGGVVITFADITEAKRASRAEIEEKAKVNMQLEIRVRERTEELGRLARELALAEVRERQSIARDLHDGLGQELNAASIKLDALRNNHDSPDWRPALDEIAQLLEGVVREMRSLTAQLNPPVLEQLGLVPALEWLSEEMRKTYRLDVSFEDDEAPKPLDSVMASILFRAVRELLINVARHANVNVANITTQREGNRLTVSVKDRGAGFASNSATNGSVGFGLATLRERIAHIGGSFQIKSALNRGTTATIQVPLAEK